MTSREPARQNNLVPAGPSELGVGWRGISLPQSVRSITARQLWFGTATRSWDRWAGTIGTRRRPPTASVLLVGEALVPDGWEDSVGIESWVMQNYLDKHVSISGAGVWEMEQVFLCTLTKWLRYIQHVQALVCLHLGYMKIDGWFHTESLSNFPWACFVYYFQACALHLPFLCFLFSSVVSENNKKEWPLTIFETHTHSHTQGFLFCRLVYIFRWG